MVAAKDILYDEFLPESPHLWLDVGLHMFAKLVSTGITMEFLVPEVGQPARLVDPLIHGGITGLVKENFIDRDSISSLGLVESRGRLPPPHRYSFEYGFLEGVGYGGIATGMAYATGL